MLIFSILMFVGKKLKLRVAYGLLTATSLSAIIFDGDRRSERRLWNSHAPHWPIREPLPPSPILPIAESRFLEARADRFVPGQPVRADAAAVRPQRDEHGSPAGIYFLTVAVQVDSGQGPIALHRGTRVRLVREQDGKFLVHHNRADFLIEKSQVTDDLNALGKLARNSS